MAFLNTFKIKFLTDKFEFQSRNLRYSRRCHQLKKMRNLIYYLAILFVLNSCEDNQESRIAVLTDKADLENFYEDVDTFWSPTKKEKDLITSISEDAFHRETADFDDSVRFNFDEYFLQIVPYVKRGQKVAYVNALCDGENLSNWKSYFYNVNDGGDCFWQVMVDLENETFSGFSMNGP